MGQQQTTGTTTSNREQQQTEIMPSTSSNLIPKTPTTTTTSLINYYFLNSFEFCTLLSMLVEQVADKLSSTILGTPLIKQQQPELKEENKQQILNVNNLCCDQGSSGDDRSESNILVEDEDEFEGFELSDLKTITTLGIGGFGRVNLVRHIDRDKVYALKILNKQHVKNKNQIEHVQNERAILMECHCDFIIRLHKTFRDSERVYMLMEYCPGGDLWTVLRSFLRLDEKKARYYCAAALEAFDYLHKRLIIYRDLKPENMLLDINGIPKLVDFGFAKRLPSEMDRAWTFCGTTEYVAPEVILGEGQDSGVDIWSLGIFLYEMLTGSPPFAASEPMLTYGAIIKGVQNLSWPRYISDNSRLLIFKLCRKNATQRLGYGHFDDLRKDIWFEGFDFTSFRNHSMRPPIRPKVLSLTDTRNFDRFSSTDDFACGTDDDGWDEDF
uniref:Uncharacterized protein n=1 Tax=Meloidogyne enterolobii TaxID=390850 RepID=A0A6V7UUY5_MELEN|nr:unnamed protein product [Meloidogyne enterolobii]